MAKKILLAAGCSYTDKNYQSFDKDIPEEQQGGWKKWPEILADELDLECINVGRCGAGADFIFNELIKNLSIYGDRIDTVAVLWSGADRMTYYSYNFNPLVEIDFDPSWISENGTVYDPFDWMDDIGIGKINRKFWASKHFNKNVYYQMIDNQLAKMVAVIDICKQKNIKFIMGQALTFLNYHSLCRMKRENRLNENAFIEPKDILFHFMNGPFFKILEKNKNHIIGWPFWRHFNGKTFDCIRQDKEQYFISKRDRHPNELGQKLFADQFINQYYEVYPKNDYNL